MPRNIEYRHIWQTYLETNSMIQAKENHTHSFAGKDKWSKKRKANDYAFFVLIFSYLEGYINDQCQILIDKKRGNPNWKRKRLWDTLDKDITRLSFDRRLSLVTDRSKNIHRDIMEYYNKRCDLAHGTLSETVDVSVFIKHVQRYLKDLKV
jgi:hypothetical protein